MNSLKFLLLPLWKITNIFLLLETSNFKQEFESLQYTMLRWEEWQNLSALAPRDELASLLAPPSKWHFPVTICLWTFSARLNAGGNAARIQHFEMIFEEDLRQAFWIRFRIEDSSIFDDFMSKFRFELKFRWIQFSRKLHMTSTLCHHFWRGFDSSFLNQFHWSQKTSNQMTNLTSLPRFCHRRQTVRRVKILATLFYRTDFDKSFWLKIWCLKILNQNFVFT